MGCKSGRSLRQSSHTARCPLMSAEDQSQHQSSNPGRRGSVCLFGPTSASSAASVLFSTLLTGLTKWIFKKTESDRDGCLGPCLSCDVVVTLFGHYVKSHHDVN